MKKLRTLSGCVAILLLVMWIIAAFWRHAGLSLSPFIVASYRSGFHIMKTHDRRPASPLGTFYSYSVRSHRSPFLRWPTFERAVNADQWTYLLVPHWFANLVAWSLFIVLWRKARKHPKGCCQKCGYDLKGNESGVCSECGSWFDVIQSVGGGDDGVFAE